jgi:DNA-binding response OmpR family regulator
VPIPPREFDLLVFLMNNRGNTMTPEEIYRTVWGNKYGDVSTVAVHIQRLRKRIEENPSDPLYIQTVHGFGYRFSDD